MSSYLQRPPPSNLLRTPPSKRISIAASDRLTNVLDRDPDAAAQVPLPPSPSRSSPSQRSLGRHSFRGRALGDAPQESEEEDDNSPKDEKAPPPYTKKAGRGVFGTIPEDRPNVVPPKPILKNEMHPAYRKPSRWEDMRERMGKRGGWGRLLLLMLVVVIVLALALGLGLGLTVEKRKHNNGASAPPTATGFPVGMWTFDVVLETQDTSCSANSATWTCFPYQTYAQSPAASRFTFNWVINTTTTDAAKLNESLTIASMPNTFSLEFGPTPLTLLDADTPTERYIFDLPLAKEVQPSVSLTPDNARTVCDFNSSTLSGALYTRANNTANMPVNASGDDSTTQDWPGTIFAAQISPDGGDCRKVTDGSQVPIAVGTGDCECAWVSGNSTTSG